MLDSILIGDPSLLSSSLQSRSFNPLTSPLFPPSPPKRSPPPSLFLTSSSVHFLPPSLLFPFSSTRRFPLPLSPASTLASFSPPYPEPLSPLPLLFLSPSRLPRPHFCYLSPPVNVFPLSSSSLLLTVYPSLPPLPPSPPPSFAPPSSFTILPATSPLPILLSHYSLT